MEKLYYREEQSFRQSFVIWLILAAWLLLIGVTAYGFYQQLYLGKPYGDNPMSNSSMLWSGIGSIILISAVFLLLVNSILVTEVWSDGIRYKFSPFINRIKHVPLSDIASAEVTKYRPLVEFGGWGWRTRIFSRKTAYNIAGRIGLRITKKNGFQLVLGTQHEEEMKRAVSKMMQRN